jgi:CHAT domain-containing protein
MIIRKQADKNSYLNYWEKIDKATGTKKTLYLSMDGIYNQISIATLQTPSGAYVLDSKNLVVLTNTKDLVTVKSSVQAAKPKIALVGFPNYGATGSVAPLPGTKIEINAIKPILTAKGYVAKEYLADNATEKNVKGIINPKILHIATHGFFAKEIDEDLETPVFGIEADKARENPMLRSGLLLAGSEATLNNENNRKSNEDGILNAFEVTNMTLDQTDLVVMSACETGLGDIKNGEGVYGLQRSFQVAGAKSILMSLWKVSDDATQQLMTAFYKNLAVSGNRVQAFRAAQKAIKIKYPQPYFWGAFVLVGAN